MYIARKSGKYDIFTLFRAIFKFCVAKGFFNFCTVRVAAGVNLDLRLAPGPSQGKPCWGGGGVWITNLPD